MSAKADYTADEWTQLLKAPMLAGLSVVTASPSGPFGVIKELFAVGKVITETKADASAGGLIKACRPTWRHERPWSEPSRPRSAG